MSRSPDYELRATVVKVLQSSQHALNFRRIQAKAGGSDWNLRMAIDYLLVSGILCKRGRKGVTTEYWLSGREFESGKPRGYDASGLMQGWG